MVLCTIQASILFRIDTIVFCKRRWCWLVMHFAFGSMYYIEGRQRRRKKGQRDFSTALVECLVSGKFPIFQPLSPFLAFSYQREREVKEEEAIRDRRLQPIFYPNDL